MRGREMEKLSVYLKSYQRTETLLWSLSGQQSAGWNDGEIPINSGNVFEVCNTF